MEIVNGKEIRDNLLKQYRKEIEKNHYHITLAIINIGEDKASKIYIRSKGKVCSFVNIECKIYEYKEIKKEELKRLIQKLNKDDSITGIMIELPLPKELNSEEILNLIHPNKDVDGLCKNSILSTCTAQAVLEILKYYGIKEKEKTVLVGYSRLIGKPLEKLLKEKGINPIICNSKTNNLKEKTKEADMIVTAVGKKNLITKDMVKENAVVIDCAIIHEDHKICGDVDYENVKEKCSFITPIPGGVGPITTAMVIKNLIELYKIQQKR